MKFSNFLLCGRHKSPISLLRQWVIAVLAGGFSLMPGSPLQAGPGTKYYSSSDQQAIGLRLGWSGAPNGLSYRKVFAPHQAFEFVAGYNHKEGRTLEVPLYKKGSSFAELRYAPFSLKSANTNDLAVGFNMNVGAALRVHHARPIENPKNARKITPEMLAGAGFQVEVSEKIQLFADLNARFYNHISNDWLWILETGAGFRVSLGQ